MSLKTIGNLVLALGALGAFSVFGQGDPYQEIVKREFGTAIPAMTAIEKEIQATKPEGYPAIETKLIGVLEAADATMPGKQFACQMLRTVGSAKCIPAVAKLLPDEKLSHMARYIFLALKEPAADEALRQAVGQTQGKLRIGVINTLGDRADRQSLATVAPMLSGTDDDTARAALNAIGKIGGTPAADLLDRAKVADALKDDWAHAYLRCAASVASADAARAEKMLQSLFDGDYPIQIRTGAFMALAQTLKERAVPMVVKMLSANDAKLSRLAAMVAVSVPGNAATRAFVQELAALAPELKVVLLGTLASRGDADGATESINKLAADENAMVRQAAITALARLGKATSVPVLVAAAKEGGTMGPDAVKSLVEMQGEGVAAAMIKQFESGDAAVRASLLTVLSDRRQVEALPAIRKAVTDSDTNVRRGALKTMATLGTQEDVSPLLDALQAATQDADRDSLAQAISSIGARLQNKTAASELVAQSMAKADAAAKVYLLNVLSTLGGDKALAAIRSCLGGEGELKKAAVRALADWPDAAPMSDLLTVAKEDKENQVLALRGYIKLAGLPGPGAEAKVQAYRAALALAAGSGEKRLVLAGLADVAHIEALKMVEPSLADASLQREAFLAYEKIAEALANREPAAAKQALQRVVDQSTDGNLRKKAQAALQKIQ